MAILNILAIFLKPHPLSKTKKQKKPPDEYADIVRFFFRVIGTKNDINLRHVYHIFNSHCQSISGLLVFLPIQADRCMTENDFPGALPTCLSDFTTRTFAYHRFLDGK